MMSNKTSVFCALLEIHNRADQILICEKPPINYEIAHRSTVASATFDRKRKTLFTVPAFFTDGVDDAWRIYSSNIEGMVEKTGRSNYWVVVDSQIHEVLAWNALANRMVLTKDNTFTIEEIGIKLYDTLPLPTPPFPICPKRHAHPKRSVEVRV